MRLTNDSSFVQHHQHQGFGFGLATKYNINLILILKIFNLICLFMSPFPGCLSAVVQSLQCHVGVSVFGDLDQNRL